MFTFLNPSNTSHCSTSLGMFDEACDSIHKTLKTLTFFWTHTHIHTYIYAYDIYTKNLDICTHISCVYVAYMLHMSMHFLFHILNIHILIHTRARIHVCMHTHVYADTRVEVYMHTHLFKCAILYVCIFMCVNYNIHT